MIIACLLVVNSSCTRFFGTKSKIKESDSSAPIAQISEDVYKGPKASIAVARFSDKTAAGGRVWWSPKVGDAMADQMTAALFRSKRFQVLNRRILEKALANHHLERSSSTQIEIQAAMGRLDETEFLVLADVTVFEEISSLPAGGKDSVIDSVSVSVISRSKAAHMAVDLKLVDSKTSTILATTRIDGKSTDVVAGAALKGVLEGWRNSLKGRAFRAVIQKAVEFLIKTIPQAY